MKDKNYTKIIVASSLVIMVVGSIALAWIMSKNFRKDVNQERYKLTKIYKEIKDTPYNYNAEDGRRHYNNMCSKCHGIDGAGSELYPPLKDSEIVKSNKESFLKIFLNGLQGPIIRNERTYNGSMPGFKNISHTDIAHIMNYIQTEINKGEVFIDDKEVISGKIKHIERKKAFTEAEL